MASRKPSARARQQAAFKTREGIADAGFADAIFAREERRRDELAAHREEVRYEKACASKNRYVTKGEAEAALLACAEHGRSGLRIYRCPYCKGWHLTSHPQR